MNFRGGPRYGYGPRWGWRGGNPRGNPRGGGGFGMPPPPLPPPNFRQQNSFGNFQNFSAGGGDGSGNFMGDAGNEIDGGEAPPPPPPPNLNPSDVLAWLDQQHPFVIRRVLFHAKWLLEQHGVPPEDLSFGPPPSMGGPPMPPYPPEDVNEDWYVEDEGSTKKPKLASSSSSFKSKHPGFGYKNNNASGLQWTPSGWVQKDNSHKVTTTMKALPPPEIIPPMSSEHPESCADKDKLKMLENNVNMMSFELTKICRKLQISTLNKDDLSIYPEDQQERLKTAINCVAAAERTLEEFKDYLKTEKYKEWNEEQKRKYDEKVKAMIGETPEGIPYTKPGTSTKSNENTTEKKEEEEEEKDKEDKNS